MKNVVTLSLSSKLSKSFIFSDEDCYTDSTSFKGKITCTLGGKTCEIWDRAGRVMPIGPDRYTNFCRDPDNTGKPWCYVKNPEPTEHSWEFCPVPEC